MGAVKDRSIVNLEEAKAYARAQNTSNTLDDFVLTIILNAAKERADFICRNPFVETDLDGFPVLDEDGNTTPAAIPMEVEAWVLRKFVKNVKHRMSGNNDESLADVGNTKLDKEDWRELSSFIRFS